MKVYRYMGMVEFNHMLWGADIIGRNSFENMRTTSDGVCFLTETVEGKTDFGEEISYSAVDAYWFLMGIVSDDVLVEFEVADDFFNHTYGNYCHAPFNDCDMTIGELCTPYYNRDICKPLRYCVPDIYRDGNSPHWFDCH